MIRNKLIQLTTAVALGSIVLTIYWVFIFISITVFELKVLKENLTETFYLSIFGIFAILGGALMVNVILNLSKIAEAVENRQPQEAPAPQALNPYGLPLVFALSFPLIFGLLFLGDHATSVRKQAFLIESAEYVVTENQDDIDHFANYSFSRSYATETANRLRRLSQEDENFPNISIIQRDQIDGKNVFLIFNSYAGWSKDESEKDPSEYIYPCSKEERQYLAKVFEGSQGEPFFSASDGNYELYYPAEGTGGRVVLYFTKYSRYGKLGS